MCKISSLWNHLLKFQSIFNVTHFFSQLTLISLDSAPWELHQYLRRMCGHIEKLEVVGSIPGLVILTSIEKQVLITYTASWELHQYSRRMCGPMKSPKVETRYRDSNTPHSSDVRTGGR